MRRTDIPQFGPLQGVKVVHSSISIAGPFCAQLMADMGADVIWIENPKAPDIARGGGFHQGWSVELNRRNMRSMALDIPSEKGREVFLKMLAATDIFIEASKGGQYDRWGLSDEELWRANPALVIVHISGFGQAGEDSYVSRASYDPIAQAFGGLMYVNSLPPKMWATSTRAIWERLARWPPCTACAKQGGGKASISPSTRPFSAVRART